MPRKPKVIMVKTEPYKGLSKRQTSSVRKIAQQQIRKSASTITVGKSAENTQLFHNKAFYLGGLLSTQQGNLDPDNQQSNAARKGDEIFLRNVNVRFWLSNKNDRPNVMYKLFLFWYDAGTQLTDAVCFFT